MKKVRVEYVFTQRPLGARLRDTTETAQPAFGTCRRTFAFDGERRYAAQAWDRGAGFVAEPTYIFDGANGFAYREGASLIRREGKDPRTDSGEYYCEGMLEIPLSDLARAQYEVSWFYPHCLRPGVRNDIVVLAEQQQIDGAWCHVVSCPGVLNWSVDPQLGFALRRKEQYRMRAPGANDAKPVRLADYSFSDFTEPEKGLWLPKQCVCVLYPNDGRALKPDVEQRVEVKTIDVNDRVTDRVFDLELAPGTMVLGKEQGFVVKGDKTKLLDLAAGKLAEIENRGSSAWKWLILINAVLAALALTLYWWRRKAGRKLPVASPPAQRP